MPEDRTPIATKYPFHQCDHSDPDRKPDSPQRQSTLTAQVYNYHCWVTWLADSCAEKTWPRGIHFRQCCDLACYMQQQHTWGYYWSFPDRRTLSPGQGHPLTLDLCCRECCHGDANGLNSLRP